MWIDINIVLNDPKKLLGPTIPPSQTAIGVSRRSEFDDRPRLVSNGPWHERHRLGVAVHPLQPAGSRIFRRSFHTDQRTRPAVEDASTHLYRPASSANGLLTEPSGPRAVLLVDPLASDLLSCRGALGQGRSTDKLPLFLHGCEALAARRRGQGGAPGAKRGRTTLRAAASSKTIRQAGEEGSPHRRSRSQMSSGPVGGALGAQSYLGARAHGPATRWLMGAVPRHNCARSLLGGRRDPRPWRQKIGGSRAAGHRLVGGPDAHPHRRTSGSLGAARGRRWLGWRHGGVAEFLQDVAGPPADLAGHRQAGPVVVDAVPDAAVVGMVRGALGEREKPWEAPVPRPGARLNAS